MNYWELTCSSEKLTTEHDNALAQNTELVAQAENLKSSLIFVASVFSGDNAKEHAEHIDWSEIHNLISKLPTQHLRDHDAEVGRAGYQACLQNIGYHEPEWQDDANAYAEKVRRGEL